MTGAGLDSYEPRHGDFGALKNYHADHLPGLNDNALPNLPSDTVSDTMAAPPAAPMKAPPPPQAAARKWAGPDLMSGPKGPLSTDF